MPPRPRPKAVPSTDYTPSTLPADHHLVRLGGPQGSNQFATEIEGEPELVDMPARVRRTAFAARGSFAIVQLYPKVDDRVAGEIVHIVTGAEVKAWRKVGEWPKKFDEAMAAEQARPSAQREANEEEDSDASLPENTNRRVVHAEPSSDEESDGE
ncbi:hypothetical protein CC85DRAFT_284255 [Cutaneotrichosporon oleaginosum]|uniref:S1-like domain-containing protein n=1 Tax=Cutaneotrichosporon oleaginosum TaxID=879819 RepID=A0A0J1B7L4_9TREE|nr:uncharacterized protein CC85DRAFT_284255 [Cutaneotrichosporon oleaginosum]KLT43744.1 hypothetical protein CC85DRAFT_284255 [Cutaneotrichosporon oleaginosum]TXT05161.1 hypothetical protein COLE_06481 [Cutaneotrichosporon oleaginosum]